MTSHLCRPYLPQFFMTRGIWGAEVVVHLEGGIVLVLLEVSIVLEFMCGARGGLWY